MSPLSRSLLAVGTCALASSELSASATTLWARVLLTGHVEDGARCLDGSPPAYYVNPGVGENATKFILFWEGGGWCQSEQDCAERATTPLGSSESYAPTMDYNERDLLNRNCTDNHAFCSWSSVYAPYCDGQSRASDLLQPVPVSYKNITALFYRGFRNLEATLSQLLSADPAPGTGLPLPSLASATHLLISGSSAGGLTTYLHADRIAERVQAANPRTIVKAVPEVGFFIDGASIWAGAHLYTDIYTRIAAMTNVTGGAPDQVDASCVAATPSDKRWQCFMAQYTYPHISTPLFILNSVEDEWQTSNILALNSNTTVAASTYPPFKPCIASPATGCNATQAAQWHGYGGQFMGALNASLAATPPAQAAKNGGFITSCAIHTTAISGFSYRIRIGGTTMYDAVVAWFFALPGAVAWRYDVPWPGNPTCPGPHLASRYADGAV